MGRYLENISQCIEIFFFRAACSFFVLCNNKHLNRVDREAHERMEVLVMQMAEKQGVTEPLKAEQPKLWIRKMNGIRTAAEDIVFTEIIYG